MANDLRIADAPEITTSNIQDGLKIPTGGFGNYSITLLAIYNWLVNNKELVTDSYLHTRDYAPVLGSPVKFRLNPIKASFLYGISDPTHLDDDLNNFRGLNSPNAWDDSNIPIGAVAIGRNNVPFAYLSFAFGHDCVAYGVASITGGAGSCTGHPDDPTGSANGVYGYCSLAVGKNTQARGRISNAMGERCLSESKYSSTDGYYAKAGKRLPSHPDYNLYGDDGAEGVASRAHGYQAEAYGNFAFSYGSFLQSYNGAQLIGKGYSANGVVKPLILSKRGLGLGYNVTFPTIFIKEGNGIEADGAWVGFNTSTPMSRYDFRFGESDTVTSVIQSKSGNGLLANEVKGLMNDGTYSSLHNVIVSHPDANTAKATIQCKLNGTEYLTVDVNRNVKFSDAVEAGGQGFVVQGKRVVGGQLPAIAKLPDDATDADRNQKINEIIDALTAHGLLAEP